MVERPIVDEDAELPESEKDVPPGRVIVPERSSEEAVQRLHEGSLPGVSGNIDADDVFRDWHELVTAPSYLEQPMQLLPYVVLDF